ncbi:hypothetical protein [Aeromonas phage 32]|nr:hypothetical protein [Aeromonas phage 32]
MTDRDSNETGQAYTSRISPDTASLEEGVSPLTREDYGLAQRLTALLKHCGNPSMVVTATVKVDTASRQVVEFQAVERGSATPELDGQSPGDGVI